MFTSKERAEIFDIIKKKELVNISLLCLWTSYGSKTRRIVMPIIVTSQPLTHCLKCL